MRRFVTLNCLVDRVDAEPFSSDAIQNLRLSLLSPIVYKPVIKEALQRVNFKFHRTCSYYNIIRVSQDYRPSFQKVFRRYWGTGDCKSMATLSGGNAPRGARHTKLFYFIILHSSFCLLTRYITNQFYLTSLGCNARI